MQVLRLFSGAFKDLLASPPGKVDLATIPRSILQPDAAGGTAGEGGLCSRAFLTALIGAPNAPLLPLEGTSIRGRSSGLRESEIGALPQLVLSGPFTEKAVLGFLESVYQDGNFDPVFELSMDNVMGVTCLAFALRAPGVLACCKRLVAEKLDVARGLDRDSDHYLLPWLEVCDAIGRGFVIFSPYAHAYIIRSRFL